MSRLYGSRNPGRTRFSFIPTKLYVVAIQLSQQVPALRVRRVVPPRETALTHWVTYNMSTRPTHFAVYDIAFRLIYFMIIQCFHIRYCSGLTLFTAAMLVVFRVLKGLIDLPLLGIFGYRIFYEAHINLYNCKTCRRFGQTIAWPHETVVLLYIFKIFIRFSSVLCMRFFFVAPPFCVANV